MKINASAAYGRDIWIDWMRVCAGFAITFSGFLRRVYETSGRQEQRPIGGCKAFPDIVL